MIACFARAERVVALYFSVRIGVWHASLLAIARPTTKEISLPFIFSEEGSGEEPTKN